MNKLIIIFILFKQFINQCPSLWNLIIILNIQRMMTTQYQKQAQMTRDQQIVAEIQYTVQKDLDNFMGIMMESIAVTEMVNRDDPLFLIHINRLIAQLNLSQTIYFDTQLNCQHNRSDSILKESKSLAYNILQEFVQSSQIKPVSEIEQLLNDYKNILQKPQTSVNMKNLNRTNQSNLRRDQQFNIQRLLNAMNQIDDEYARIRNGQQVQLEDKQQLFDKVSCRYQIAQQKVQIYLNSQYNNNPIQNSQLFNGNHILQNDNTNQNQNYNIGMGNGENSNSNVLGHGNSSGNSLATTTTSIIVELQDHSQSQIGIEQGQQNITNLITFEQDNNNNSHLGNQNPQNKQQESHSISPETLQIIKTLIYTIQHTQPNQLDLSRIFSFLHEYQPQQVILIGRELEQLKQRFPSQGKIKYMLYSIQVCLNTKNKLELSASDIINIQSQDSEILNEIIREDFK
ncbi:hypothetical protein pb186bvf_016054 [Paramecium bursaria]